jgi:ATP-dependent DNA helicase RecG
VKAAVAGLKPSLLEGKFQKLGLRRGFDFILHLPLRYEDETVLGSLDSALPGVPLQIEARVEKAQIAYRPRRQLVVHAEGMVLRFYNFYGSQLKQFQRAATEGLRVRAFGELRGGWFGAEMVHPRYRIVREGDPLPDALTPVYPTTAGLPQRELRARVLQARTQSHWATR